MNRLINYIMEVLNGIGNRKILGCQYSPCKTIRYGSFRSRELVPNTQYGAMVYITKDMVIPVEQSIEFICDGHDLEKLVAFSRDFRRVLKLAKDNNCTWLRLDCDGSEIEGLPRHEW